MENTSENLGALTRTDPGPLAQNIPMPSKHWKARVLLPGFIILSFGVVLAYTGRDMLWPALEVQVVPVIAKASNQSGGGISFQAPGWVEADPYSYSVSALTDGVIADVLVLEGDRVKAGQVVARMVDDDAKLALQGLDAELKEKEADVKTAKAVLNAAQRDWDHPVERVRAVSIATERLAEGQADLKKQDANVKVEVARLEEIKEKLRREEKAGSPAIPAFKIVQTRLRVKTQEALIESVRADLPILQARIKRFTADLTAEKENLRLRIEEKKTLDAADATVARFEAALNGTRTQRAVAALKLKRMDVVATVDGIVMRRLVNPGDKLMLMMDMPHSAHAVHLYDPKKLQIRVDVPLADAAKISVGREAEIVVEVLPDRIFKGHISRIVHEADIQKNTLQVKVAIKDPVMELKPEMLARVKFMAPVTKTKSATERVFIPEKLLQSGGEGGASVWLLDQGKGEAIKRSVTPGNVRLEGWLEIKDGLQMGDLLIASEINKLSPGKKVRMTEESK